MLHVEINTKTRVVSLEPEGPLTKEDFGAAARIINPVIEAYGMLSGVLIHAPEFPSWDSFSALIAHLQFVKDHHRKIRRVALVTDSALANFAEALVSHFVSAQIKHFVCDDIALAQQWLENSA